MSQMVLSGLGPTAGKICGWPGIYVPAKSDPAGARDSGGNHLIEKGLIAVQILEKVGRYDTVIMLIEMWLCVNQICLLTL